jgi:hypothetical protein
MYEYVLSVFTRNKSKAFRGVKPLHRSSFFLANFVQIDQDGNTGGWVKPFRSVSVYRFA